MKDYFGREIEVGDLIVYGKSSRENPLKVGIVQDVDGDSLTVLGEGNTKPGTIRCYDYSDSQVNNRVVILPNNIRPT